MQQSMKISDYEVSVHLGCSLEEQKHAQPVLFQVDLVYRKNVEGCLNDQLEDATDYVALTDIIKRKAQAKNYHLIEHLNHEVLLGLKKFLIDQSFSGELKLSVQKLRVPVENLRGGVYFTCQIDL